MPVKTAVASAEEPEPKPAVPWTITATAGPTWAGVTTGSGGFRTTTAALKAFTAQNITFRPALRRQS